MKRIVWLASWYPSEADWLTGDFIKRHAQACSLFQPADVIHVKRVSGGGHKNKTVTAIDPGYPNLQETVVYYHIHKMAGLEGLYSYLYSLWLYHQQVRKFIKQYGKPAFLHVHVMLRCGLVALYYKWVHKIPYIITEHYAGYMPGAEHFIKGVTLFNRLPLKLVAENAAIVAPVSEALGQAMAKEFRLKKMVVVPNTVNTTIFNPVDGAAKNQPPVFLHVSSLLPQKNPEAMLAAFAVLDKEFGCGFELWIVGPQRPRLREIAVELGIHQRVKWLEETSQQNLAALMRQSAALVLYSRFESFGCVNIEAMACGLPVIVSDLPVFREYEVEGVTAWFASAGHPATLASVLYKFSTGKATVDARVIASHALRFDYNAIGRLIAGLYV